jgi:thiol-disulfide isomerase/thioredoxin
MYQMKRNLLNIIVAVLFLAWGMQSLGQTKVKPLVYPEVGKPCPNVVLRNIKYFKRKSATIGDFRGKWLVLDFWSQGCGACVASFPHYSKLAAEFGDKVQFMMVGNNDRKNKRIQYLYAQFKEKQNLLMPCAFDSLLFKRFDVFGLPYVITIDDQGIVRAITTGVTIENMSDFLAGKHPVLENKAYRAHEDDGKAPYDFRKPFLVGGNGGKDTDFLFRSLLAKYKPYMNISGTSQIYPYIIKLGKLDMVGNLSQLYNMAYTGRRDRRSIEDKGYSEQYDSPVFELSDSTGNHVKKMDTPYFCYSLIVPKALSTKAYLMHCMQRDLMNYFSYAVNIEKRKMPCWRLTATEQAKLKLKPKKPGLQVITGLRGADYKAENLPIQKLMELITEYADIHHFILLNDTGIQGNIDIDLSDCTLTDFEGFKKSLRKYGLNVVPGQKEMDVVVVRDAPPVSLKESIN